MTEETDQRLSHTRSVGEAALFLYANNSVSRLTQPHVLISRCFLTCWGRQESQAYLLQQTGQQSALVRTPESTTFVERQFRLMCQTANDSSINVPVLHGEERPWSHEIMMLPLVFLQKYRNRNTKNALTTVKWVLRGFKLSNTINSTYSTGISAF